MSYSERFWNEFQKNIDNEIDKNANFMDIYKGRDKYTRKMNNKKYGIISKTIKAIDSNMEIQKEYFRVDVTAWKSMFDRKHNPNDIARWMNEFSKRNMNPHLWNLYFAVEHENDSEDWMDEVLKLVHLRCPLKVVIGYVPWDKRADRYQGDNGRLKLATECLKWTKAYERQPSTYLSNSTEESSHHEEFWFNHKTCGIE